MQANILFLDTWQMECEAAQRVAHRCLEDELCRQDVAGDLSEELSEAENVSEPLTPNGGGGSPKSISIDQSGIPYGMGYTDHQKERWLYIVMIR
jgi:hypothetical protein